MQKILNNFKKSNKPKILNLISSNYLQDITV